MRANTNQAEGNIDQIYTPDALALLYQSTPPREAFGPGSDHPLLAFELGGSDGDLAEWMTDLPCPVIGIGDGALAPACDVVLGNEDELPRIASNVEAAPIAAMVLVQLLRMSEKQPLADALLAESYAYSTVQQGPEFQAWLDSQTEKASPLAASNPVLVKREYNALNITLTDPDNRNAIGVSMRDALCEAFDLALRDPQIARITLAGQGPVFSSGGEVAEFGQTPDPATAHHIRSLRLPAWRLARLNERLEILVNGAAIGAGAEIAAFGAKVRAVPSAWFQLPELKYGLIPGAGGTASLPHRIGRQRTAYMALSMKRIDAQTALEWGLVDEIVS